MAGVIKVENQTVSETTRTTKAGKQLKYRLEVLQQPERARACGAGAKSSADRRPVDPPPVVELVIYEDGTDVTFQYNANFFLFATLEAARTQAQPRGQPVTPPVLTGVPVAGMAYLDRPKPAGYFIFPDLSVRHEGNYRLSFGLFEEIKDPKDDDAPSTASHPSEKPLIPVSNKTGDPTTFLHFRLVVRSQPFQVYSAKKFPGLAESTQLSRMVAEQGCRVRIRRDVRMRRRDAHGKDGYYEEGEVAYPRTDRIATPDNYSQPPMPDRARSASRGSIDAPHGYGIDSSRRPSMTDIGQYHQQGYRPQTPIQAAVSRFPTHPQQSHLSFGGPISAPQYGIPPLPQPPPAVSVSNSHAPGYQYHASPHSRRSSNPQLCHYISPQQPIYHPNVCSDPPEFNINQDSTSEYQRPMSNMEKLNGYPYEVTLPKPAHIPRSMTPVANYPTLPPVTALQSCLNSLAPKNGLKSVPVVEYIGPRFQSRADELLRPTKRTFETVFPSAGLSRPLHFGQRPDTLHHADDHIDPDLYPIGDQNARADQDVGIMEYKRANGQLAFKRCPSSQDSSPIIETRI